MIDLNFLNDVNTKESSPFLSPEAHKFMGQILLWFSYPITSPVVPVVELNRIKDFALAVLTFMQRRQAWPQGSGQEVSTCFGSRL